MTSVPGFDPLKNLPAGRVLTRPQHDELWSQAIALGRELTTSEIEDIVGLPLETVQMKRDFATGEYPTAKSGLIGKV